MLTSIYREQINKYLERDRTNETCEEYVQITHREKIKEGQPIVFVDLSYFVFTFIHRFLKSNLAVNERKTDGGDWIDRTEIMDELIRKLLYRIKQLPIKYKTCPQNIFLVQDCSRRYIWRNKLYPTYKHGRTQKADSIGETESSPTTEMSGKYLIFFFITKIFIPSHPELRHLMVWDAEADDTIAIFTEILYVCGIPNKVNIITCDNDFLQLYRFPTVQINDYHGNMVNHKWMGETIEDTILVHILAGDKGDNIKPVVTWMNKKEAQKMVRDRTFHYFITKTPEIQRRFELNRCLIDFRYIPYFIRQRIANIVYDIISFPAIQYKNDL